MIIQESIMDFLWKEFLETGDGLDLDDFSEGQIESMRMMFAAGVIGGTRAAMRTPCGKINALADQLIEEAKTFCKIGDTADEKRHH